MPQAYSPAQGPCEQVQQLPPESPLWEAVPGTGHSPPALLPVPAELSGPGQALPGEWGTLGGGRLGGGLVVEEAGEYETTHVG